MSAAVASRALGVPSATIRSWIKRDKVHRLPNGQIDLGCLRARIARDTLTKDEYVDLHSELCNTLRNTTTV